MGQFTFSGGGGGGGGGVTSVFGRAGVVVAVSGDYTASLVTNVPAGNIGSVTVQAAVNELDTEKAGLALANIFTAANTFNFSGATPPTPFGTDEVRLIGSAGVNPAYWVDTFDGAAVFAGRRANGTPGSPSAVTNGQTITSIRGYGYGATGYAASQRAAISLNAAETWTDAAQGTRVVFATTTNGAVGQVARWNVDNDGSLIYNGGSLTGNGSVNALDYFDTGVNINLIYASLALPNVFTALQTVNLNTSALPAPISPTTVHLGAADTNLNRMLFDAFGAASSVGFRRASGTNAAKTGLLLNEPIGNFVGFGYGATGYSATGRAFMTFTATENWTDLAQGTRISFTTTTNGGIIATGRWNIENDGSLIYNGGSVTGVSTINALGYWHTNVEVIDANRIFRPRSYTIGTLPAVPATGIIHCSDLGGGAGLLSSDGTGWVREDHSGTTTIATDAGHTLTWTRLTSAPTIRGNATLTALRTATLSTAGCRNGDRASFVRLGGGAFNWDIAGGTTFSLTAADQFCTFEFDGTTWNIVEAGQISVASGGGGVDVEDEGTLVLAAATTLNFVGAGVTATNAGGGQVDITIPGGGGGSGLTIGKYIGLRNSSYF